jgi:hypothetical protein
MKKLTTLLVMAAVVGSFLVVGCGKKDTQTQMKDDANAAVASAEKDAAAAQKDADKKAEEAKKAASGLLNK